MWGSSLRCGGKDRGLPPVSSVDIPLGLVLVAGAAAVLGTAALGFAAVALSLLRLLGAPSAAAAAVALAGAAAGAVALLCARLAGDGGGDGGW